MVGYCRPYANCYNRGRRECLLINLFLSFLGIWVSLLFFSLQSLLYIHVMFTRFQSLETPSADHFKLYTFEFNDLELTDDETVLASIRMMLELDFLNAVHTKREVTDYTLT